MKRFLPRIFVPLIAQTTGECGNRARRKDLWMPLGAPALTTSPGFSAWSRVGSIRPVRTPAARPSRQRSTHAWN
ncbi:MAG: hypothetical protein JXB85_00645 [Anaerolineales bacterium]|nr:hypothetical protein [Anaerolineales bacterium]